MDLLEEYKKKTDLTKFEDENGNIYRLRVIGRGEHLFFQENDNALICAIDAVHDDIYIRSIRTWNNDEKMNRAEQERVINLIAHYYEKAFNRAPTLDDSN